LTPNIWLIANSIAVGGILQIDRGILNLGVYFNGGMTIYIWNMNTCIHKQDGSSMS